MFDLFATPEPKPLRPYQEEALAKIKLSILGKGVGA